jgi:hypothetical protein
MGPFVGTSPRTVKRFVNVYRLIRAMQTGAAFEDFVRGPQDGSDAGPLYRPVQLCLAVQCGMKEGLVERFREGMEAEGATTEVAFAGFLDHWRDPSERNGVLQMLNEYMAAGGAARLREARRHTERFAFWTGVGAGAVQQSRGGAASG